MGIAAGALMSTKGIEDGVEILNMKFNHPFDLEVGCRIVCNHHYGGGMEFNSQSPEGATLMVASIAGVNARLSALTMESLDNLKHQHTRKVMTIQEHYARLSWCFFHRGAFQSIKSVLLSEDGKSALGCVSLPEGVEHNHDAYYHAHPAVLDGAFQLISFMTKLLEGVAWVSAGTSYMVMYHDGELRNGEQGI